MDNNANLFAGLPPEAVQELMHLGTLNDQDALLQDQMKQAIALRQNSSPEGYGLAGGITHALGHMMNTYASMKREGEARQGLQGNLAAEGHARGLLGQALMGGQMGQSPLVSQMAQAQALQRPKPPPLLDADPSQAMAGYGLGGY